jgi:hypothetical protein
MNEEHYDNYRFSVGLESVDRNKLNFIGVIGDIQVYYQTLSIFSLIKNNSIREIKN